MPKYIFYEGIAKKQKGIFLKDLPKKVFAKELPKGFFVKGLGKQRPRMTTAGSYASGEDGLDSLEFCEHDGASCVSRDGRGRE